MTRVALSHRTTYRYDRPASLGPQLIRLRPAPHTRTIVERYALAIGPAEHLLHWQQDPFANWIARASFPDPVDAFEIRVELDVDLRPVNPFDFVVEFEAASRPFAYAPALAGDLAPFLAGGPGGERFERLAASFDGRTGGTVDFLIALNAAVRAEVDYIRRDEAGTRSPEETLTLGRGSCRDSGWLLVLLLRRLGTAARFVSGYSIQLADGAEVPEDTADLHAWAEAFVPGAGWIGLDSTSGLLTGAGHIPLAATPRLEAAAPVEGNVYGEVVAAFDAGMVVRRL